MCLCPAIIPRNFSYQYSRPGQNSYSWKNRHPWFTPENRVLIQERDRLYKRFRRSRTGYDLLVYREAHDLAHRSVEEARNNYYHYRLSTLTDPKDIWRELEHLGISGPRKSNSSSFSNDQLNAHFRSVSYDPATPSVFDYLSTLTSSNNAECFTFREFQISDICDAVNQFSTQARGPDGIPQRVILLALPFLAPAKFLINPYAKHASRNCRRNLP